MGSIIFPALSSLLPFLRPLRQIHTDQDFRSLPELYQVDDILQGANREAHESHQLGPGKGQKPGGLRSQRTPERRVNPFHKIKGNEKHFIASADNEKKGLKTAQWNPS